RAHAKGLELNSHVGADVPRMVLGDPERLRQVLVNLTGNAVKFTERGEVSLSAERISAEGSGAAFVRIACRDTGIGIPEQRASRLFRSFSQVDASTTRKYGGTGLGLAICKQIVELMGGQIGVESREGEGSTFWLTIPAALAQNTGPTPRMPETLADVRALLVDDNDTNLQILREYLTRWGIQPTSVASARDAMREMKAAASAGTPYRLAILDRLMPEVDGLELAHMIRSDNKLGHPRLIMLTSLNEDLTRDELRRLDLSCLQKPVRQSRLFDAVITATQVRSDESFSERPATTAPPRVASPVNVQSPRRILVVDDNDVNRVVASEILRAAGYTPSTARNGREAIELVQREAFDAVLMDCEMPEVDGFEATQAIRQWEADKTRPLPRRHRLPIIALTAQAVQGDRDRCLAAGMTDYVTKPVDRVVLIECLERCICPPADTAHDLHANAAEASVAGTGTTGKSEVAQCSVRLDELHDRFDGNADLIRHLLGMFQSHTLQQAEDLSEAVEKGNWNEVRSISHNLKGSAANLAAVDVSLAAGELERAAVDGRTPDLVSLYENMMTVLDRCQKDVARLLTEETPS
ncbi:MAG: response regulator, partial [Planctomycetaceae bacterium]|nr:response regulator [Planctomycetaceae bacterium]